MKIRFKQITKDFEYRIAYTVENEVPQIGYDEIQEKYCMGYELKELGFVDAELLEITEGKNYIDAIDVIVKIQNGKV